MQVEFVFIIFSIIFYIWLFNYIRGNRFKNSRYLRFNIMKILLANLLVKFALLLFLDGFPFIFSSDLRAILDGIGSQTVESFFLAPYFNFFPFYKKIFWYFLYVFSSSQLLLPLSAVIYETALAFIIFKISKLPGFKTPSRDIFKKNIVLFLLSSPLLLSTLRLDLDFMTSVIVFYLALYFFYKKNVVVSGILLGFLITFSLYFILLSIPFLQEMARHGRKRDVGFFSLLYLAPYLCLFAITYFFSNFYILLQPLFFKNVYDTLFHDSFWRILAQIDLQTIVITQVIVTFVLFVIAFYFFKGRAMLDQLVSIILIMFVVQSSFNFSWLVMVLPLTMLKHINDKSNSQKYLVFYFYIIVVDMLWYVIFFFNKNDAMMMPLSIIIFQVTRIIQLTIITVTHVKWLRDEHTLVNFGDRIKMMTNNNAEQSIVQPINENGGRDIQIDV